MEILLTKRANSNLITIRDNIEKIWGQKSASAFELRVHDFFEILKAFPQIGSVEEVDKAIYGFQISKQTRVFYRIKGKRIIILNFFEVRQHPNKKY
jgi:plasmid stabilization system protein ParE